MKQRSRRRRLGYLGIVAVLGVAVGLGGYLAYLVATAPGARSAPRWTLLAAMPGARGETAAAVTDGRLYVIGGLAGVAAQATADVSVYDHGANAWSAGPPLPAARHHAAATAVGGSVYLTGGAASATDWGPTDTAWVLRPGESTWDAVAPMPGSRLGHRIVSLGSRLYVIGGVGRDAASSRGTVLTYDPAADAWSEGAALPVSRDHLAVVVVGDEIWAVGGRAGGINHARVDIYDPAADTWRDGPPLPEATSGAAEGVVDGVILLSGGEDPGAGRIVDRHWRLDTTLGPAATWETLSPPPWTVHGAPGVVLGGRFVVVSGSLRPGGQSSTAWTGATQALVAAP